MPLLESEGAPLALAFNARYLREAVERANPLVRARFSGKTTPAVIEAEGYEAVIVPLRV